MSQARISFRDSQRCWHLWLIWCTYRSDTESTIHLRRAQILPESRHPFPKRRNSCAWDRPIRGRSASSPTWSWWMMMGVQNNRNEREWRRNQFVYADEIDCLFHFESSNSSGDWENVSRNFDCRQQRMFRLMQLTEWMNSVFCLSRAFSILPRSTFQRYLCYIGTLKSWCY